MTMRETKEQIQERYLAIHDKLSDRYYRQGNPDGYTPKQFRAIHDKIWIDLEIELRENNLTPPIKPKFDDELAASMNVDDKVDAIIRYLKRETR